MRVLIFKKEADLKPVGGSLGYCYNLKLMIEKLGISELEFLKGESDNSCPKLKANTFRKYASTFIKLLFPRRQADGVDFSFYDVVHFHSPIDLYRSRQQLKNFKGKVVLTSHSPVPFHMEITQNIRTRHKFLGLFLRKHAFSHIDRYAFRRADFILFPCKEAEEPYFGNWKTYKKIHEKNAKKFCYIPTGIVAAQAKVGPEDYRLAHNLSTDDFVVAYVGRHNSVKGYDRLIKIAGILSDFDAKFLIAGREFPMKGPSMPNWQEIGWTDDPSSLINAADVFVLPNRETYFDIVLLEALSLGAVCLISATGGNKHILAENPPGVFGFDSEKEAASLLKSLASRRGEFPLLREQNRRFFRERYEVSVFLREYLSWLQSIVECDGERHEKD